MNRQRLCKGQLQSAVACWAFFALPMLMESPLVADELVLSASDLYDQSVADQVLFDKPGESLILASGVLHEDDGPAAGFSYQPNVETLSENVRIKKQLIVSQPRATSATLLIGCKSTDLKLQVNGQDTSLTSIGKVGNYWQAFRIESTLLKSGVNEFILWNDAESSKQPRERVEVWIARDDEYATGAEKDRNPPNRSFKSSDGGKTWTDKSLGAQGGVDGEYYVRLLLQQFVPKGNLLTPVIDVGNLSKQVIGPPVTEVGTVKFKLRTGDADAEHFRMFIRSGTTLAVSKESWDDWQEFKGTTAEVAKPRGRYLQLRVELLSADGLVTPQVKGLEISVTPSRPHDWSVEWKLVEADNPMVRCSPVPFAYEPFDEPKLKKFREQEKLDAVVKGAKTQFEAACELAKWSSQRLANLGHLGQVYPAWNALEILASHTDGTAVGGFCQQYNLLFLQACLSQGLTVRAVSVGPGNRSDRFRSGHETVELWSNDYRKWVYLDGNTGWYIKDVETGIPLSIWEVRQRQLAAANDKPYPAIELVKLIKTRYDWPDLSGGFGFIEMRLIPRNNFLSQPSPLPLNQGMRGWFWPGHWVSADQEEPVGTLYAHRLFRQADAEWSLNHAHIVFEATATPDEVCIHFDSETPGWEKYLATWNDEPQAEVGPHLVRKLRPGVNRISVIPRNTRGVLGSTTFVEIQHP